MGKPSEALIFLSEHLPIRCQQSEHHPKTSCLEEIQSAIIETAYMLGYDYIRYSYWIKSLSNEDREINSFSINVSNFPQNWERYYNDHSIYLVDPIVRIIQENTATSRLIHGSWSDAYMWALQNPLGATWEDQERYTRSVTELIASSRKYHLNSGYYYCWSDTSAQIVLSLASTQNAVETAGSGQNEKNSGAFIKGLHSMVMLINQAVAITQGCNICSKPVRIDGSETVQLSEAELYVLQLFHRHRQATLRQVAAHYGRSVDTVNHHLRSIRTKLNAPGASGHSLASYAAELKLI